MVIPGDMVVCILIKKACVQVSETISLMVLLNYQRFESHAGINLENRDYFLKIQTSYIFIISGEWAHKIDRIHNSLHLLTYQMSKESVLNVCNLILHTSK